MVALVFFILVGYLLFMSKKKDRGPLNITDSSCEWVLVARKIFQSNPLLLTLVDETRAVFFTTDSLTMKDRETEQPLTFCPVMGFQTTMG